MFTELFTFLFELIQYLATLAIGWAGDISPGITLFMSWVAWWHSGPLVPIWFALILDAFFLSIAVKWTIRLVRIAAAIFDAVPLLS